MIYFHVNFNGTSIQLYSQIIKAFLFDGKTDTISNKLTLRFKDNCISKFDQEFYKTGEIFIYMLNSLEFASYNSAFESSCYDSVTEKPTTQIASSFCESVSSQKIKHKR